MNKQWCSGCAKVGHLYHECRNVTREHFNALPYVTSYDVVSTKKLQRPPVPAVMNNINVANISRIKEELFLKNHNKCQIILKTLIRQCKCMNLTGYLQRLWGIERDFNRNGVDQKRIGELYHLRKLIKNVSMSHMQ